MYRRYRNPHPDPNSGIVASWASFPRPLWHTREWGCTANGTPCLCLFIVVLLVMCYFFFFARIKITDWSAGGCGRKKCAHLCRTRRISHRCRRVCRRINKMGRLNMRKKIWCLFIGIVKSDRVLRDILKRQVYFRVGITRYCRMRWRYFEPNVVLLAR